MPDLRYTTIIVHKGNGIPLHTQSLGPMRVAVFGNSNHVRIGKIANGGRKFTTLKQTGNFAKVTGTHELQYNL